MIAAMKKDLHDRLWNAQQRWFSMRSEGCTKFEVKMAGVRQFGDQNYHMRPILFTGRTRVTYERTLKNFLNFAHSKFGIQRLDDLDTPHAKAFLDDAIQRGLAAKTLHTYRSALAKLGAVIHRTSSMASLSRKYGSKIRELVAAGAVPGPERGTPSREVLERAIAVLKAWDTRQRGIYLTQVRPIPRGSVGRPTTSGTGRRRATCVKGIPLTRHFDRTGEERVYHLAARLQLETAARSVSVTARLTASSLRDGNQVALVAKGGKVLDCTLPPDLHRTLRLWFAHHPGPLAGQRGYQTAYARAIRAAGGRVTGTHGARRRSAQDYYSRQYRQAVGSGVSPAKAADQAAGDAIERLGHSRDRRDHRHWYLSR